MSIKSRFLLSGILMLVIPIAVNAFISAAMLAFFFLSDTSHMEYLRAGINIYELLENVDFQRLTVLWGVICFVVVCLNSAIITLYLSRTLLGPLEHLKKAAKGIGAGDLDSEILTSKYTELNELCGAFNTMRMRLKESARARREHEDERSMMIANLSHDLRTPITSIKGYVEGITDGVADTPERVNKYLETIRQKTETIEELVESMSEFSAYEMNMVGYNFENTDIVPLLKDIIMEYRLDLESEGVELVERIPESGCELMLDSRKLRRVFGNLIINAVKYRGADSPVIDISLDIEKNGVCVVITDNGVGISREDISKVFDGHFRGDRSRNSGIKGYGLGLSISKQIVEAHKGRIWLRSEEEKGTSAFVFLPLS